jgi:hypothetical protein
MCCNCQDIAYVSPEYSEFTREYYKFQNYCLQTSLLLGIINTLIELRNTRVFGLYTQAVETHILAINAFIKLVVLQEMLAKKYWNRSHG